MQQKNLILFVVLAMLILFGSMELQRWLLPPKQKPQQSPPEHPATVEWPWEKQPRDAISSVGSQSISRLIAAGAVNGTSDALWHLTTEIALTYDKPDMRPISPAEPVLPTNNIATQLIVSTGPLLPKLVWCADYFWAKSPKPVKKAEVKAVKEPNIPAVTRGSISLGDDNGRKSNFNLHVVLQPAGAGVQEVVLNRFQQANADGWPVWQDPQTKKQPEPLHVVPKPEVPSEPIALLLYHYANPDKPQDRPEDTLATREWEVVEEKQDEEEARVVFRTEVDNVIFTKTYTLKAGDYHLGLEIGLQLKEGAASKKVRYELTTAHGLPVEGPYKFRNAVIEKSEGRNPWRTLWETTNAGKDTSWKTESGWTPEPNKKIDFLGMFAQYFASIIAVDKDKDNPQADKDDFLESVRPVIEKSRINGSITSIAPDGKSFVLTVKDSKWLGLSSESNNFAFQVEPGSLAQQMVERDKQLGLTKTNVPVSVIYKKDRGDGLAMDIFIVGQQAAGSPFLDDVSLRATSKTFVLEAGKPVTHKYLFYNGPVKVRLLLQQEDYQKNTVSAKLVDHYINDLHLNEMTDSPSTWVSRKISWTGWSWLLTKCTNLMHDVLWFLHRNVMPWSYGLCIILLTVLVRGAMFPVSRKQAMTGIKMQQLAPELKKIQEKLKGDRQALGVAQMELYRKHGVHPLGSCWLIFLQMPIFLGLYYALQESIHFRLAPLFPGSPWIQNLAAPDMLLEWGQHIPLISSFLGPYFNLLPMLAVALMIAQQSMMTPPAMDEQQAMQMKMMKYMMVFMGLMFYKVAAGLCLYFIASSIWGFTERKLLPKRKTSPDGARAGSQEPGLLGRTLNRLQSPSASGGGAAAPGTNSGKQEERSLSRRRQKRLRQRQTRGGRREETTTGGGSVSGCAPGDQNGGAMQKARAWWADVREWWAELLKKASKK